MMIWMMRMMWMTEKTTTISEYHKKFKISKISINLKKPNVLYKRIMFIETENKQVVAHLYRGEMNRLTVYRQRLDTTTNWAITLESAILVIYTDRRVEFYFIFFPLIILLFLSFLEARRYRYFFTSAKRVQYLEIEYFGKQIFNRYQSNNIQFLIDNIMDVRLLIGLRQAWITRFYRNYIWLYYISLVIMTYKYMTIEFHNTYHLIFSIIMWVSSATLHAVLHYLQHPFIDL